MDRHVFLSSQDAETKVFSWSSDYFDAADCLDLCDILEQVITLYEKIVFLYRISLKFLVIDDYF